ncbi:MAG: hypothetical protein ACLFTQ_00225 [Candidatus Aenigmatarchaeota archaeon]
MSLLILSEENDLEEKFQPHFERVEHRKLSQTRVNLIDEENVLVDGMDAKSFDSLLVITEKDIVIYLRALLEMVEKNVRSNLDSLSAYILTKKQYLYKVLNEKNVNTPNAVSLGSKKGLKGMTSLDYPVVARKYTGFIKKDSNLLENKEEAENFMGSLDYGKESVILQELAYGEVFDCLVIGDEVISIKMTDEGRWDLQEGECNEKYHKAPSDIKDLVQKARLSIGAKVCRVKVVGNKVVNMYSRPHLDRFKNISGKDVYRKTAELLKGEE